MASLKVTEEVPLFTVKLCPPVVSLILPKLTGELTVLINTSSPKRKLLTLYVCEPTVEIYPVACIASALTVMLPNGFERPTLSKKTTVPGALEE